MSIITIDSRMIDSSGIGTYLQNVLPRIINNTVHQFFLLGNAKKLSRFNMFISRRVSLIECNAPIYSLKEQLEIARLVPNDTNLYWSPHYNIPLLYTGKILVTVHDLFHLAMPQYVKGIHQRMYARMMFNVACRKTTSIICVSNFTKQELERLVHHKKPPLAVIYNGVADDWQDFGPGRIPDDKPYFLYVGNVKPYKNLVNLLEAFGKLTAKIPHELMIVGKKEGFITEDREVAAKASHLGDRVRFTGFIERDLLRQYYKQAAALVFPSRYEGFGLPPLEAMASGCAVIVSNAASLPEICGNAALYCDPDSADDIANKMMEIIHNLNLKESLIKKGYRRVEEFTWDKCAAATIKVIEEIVSN